MGAFFNGTYPRVIFQSLSTINGANDEPICFDMPGAGSAIRENNIFKDVFETLFPVRITRLQLEE